MNDLFLLRLPHYFIIQQIEKINEIDKKVVITKKYVSSSK